MKKKFDITFDLFSFRIASRYGSSLFSIKICEICWGNCSTSLLDLYISREYLDADVLFSSLWLRRLSRIIININYKIRNRK